MICHDVEALPATLGSINPVIHYWCEYLELRYFHHDSEMYKQNMTLNWIKWLNWWMNNINNNNNNNRKIYVCMQIWSTTRNNTELDVSCWTGTTNKTFIIGTMTLSLSRSLASFSIQSSANLESSKFNLIVKVINSIEIYNWRTYFTVPIWIIFAYSKVFMNLKPQETERLNIKSSVQMANGSSSPDSRLHVLHIHSFNVMCTFSV